MFFSTAEAAEVISNTRTRQWQRYESGDAPIPADVVERLLWFLEFYYATYESYDEEVEKQLEASGIAYIPLKPAEIKRGDLPKLVVDRVHEAVVARLKLDYLKDLEIVEHIN